MNVLGLPACKEVVGWPMVAPRVKVVVQGKISLNLLDLSTTNGSVQKESVTFTTRS